MSKNNVGYVYLIRTGIGLYKIGRTKNIDRRHKQYRTIDPLTKRIVVALVDNYKEVEKELIKMFRSKRRYTKELFELEKKDIFEIEQYLEYNKTTSRSFK